MSRCRRLLFLAPVLLLPLLGACAAEVTSQESPPPGDDGILAEIDGVPIRVSDLPEEVADQLSTLEYQYGSQRYQVLQVGLEQAVRERLIEGAAEAAGMTSDQFVQARLEGKVEVSDTDVEQWYAANQGRLQGRSLEMLQPAIRQFLIEQQQEALLAELTEELAAERSVSRHLQPFRANLETEGHPTFGPGNAPVTLVEFSDFECPYCRGFWETIERVKSEYEGSVKLVYRQFPLRQIHPNAQKSAEASLCAEEQGQFWQLHDLMFAEQQSLTVPDLKEKAERLGMDAAAFSACLDSGKYFDQVEADLQAGARMGISGTPALFVNGRPVEGGAVPFESIAEIIDDELERLGR